MQMWNVEDKKKMNGYAKTFCSLRLKSNRSVTLFNQHLLTSSRGILKW